MMFFVVVAYIKPVLYKENRLIQYNISRNVSFNILSLNDWLVNILIDHTRLKFNK